jgi:hypothetical protein
MNTKHYRRILFACLPLAALSVTEPGVRAAIRSEGTGETLRYGYGETAGGLDANTTHLWRFDDDTSPLADSTTVGATAIPLEYVGGGVGQIDSILKATDGAPNSARQIDNNSGSSAGANIIRALPSATTEPSSDDNLSADQYNSFFGADGAFTIDFLMRSDITGELPTTDIRIFSQEGNDLDTEPNLFSLLWLSGTTTLELVAVPGEVEVAMPTTGDHAYAASTWYHVAFAYDGNEGVADNTKFYFTKVDGPDTALAHATEEANLAGTYTFASDPMTITSGPGPEWNIGNRPNGNRAFDGVLDEFRISNVARGADEFIFTESTEQPGDHNDDGVVDAADYVDWRKDPGSFDPDAYDVWVANFGAGGGGGGNSNGGSVPEPTAIALLIAAAGVYACGVRRNRD